MNYFVAQIILAARRRDTEGWMQILVFVVLIVFYALGSIVKAKSRKLEEDSDEEITGRPPHRPPERMKGLQKQPRRPAGAPVGPALPREYEPQRQPIRRKVVRPQPAVERPLTEKQPPLERPWEMPEMLELPLLGPQVQHGIKELPEFTTETIEELEAKSLGFAAQKPVVEDVSSPVLDYADADELTRAILHYEILGKPLSLRGPSEQIIGF